MLLKSNFGRGRSRSYSRTKLLKSIVWVRALSHHRAILQIIDVMRWVRAESLPLNGLTYSKKNTTIPFTYPFTPLHTHPKKENNNNNNNSNNNSNSNNNNNNNDNNKNKIPQKNLETPLFCGFKTSWNLAQMTAIKDPPLQEHWMAQLLHRTENLKGSDSPWDAWLGWFGTRLGPGWGPGRWMMRCCMD